MSIVHKNISTVNKKSAPKEEKVKAELNLGLPPSNGKECMPSFVWALQERTGTENVYYEYKDKKNNTAFYIRRYEPYETGNDSSTKKMTPYSYDLNSGSWVCYAWPKDRPLFTKYQLEKNKPLIMAEGEKTVLEAKKLFPDYDCATWSGGTKAVFKSDFTILKDKEVILFPDNDKVGLEAMHEVAKILIEEEITDDVYMVHLPKELPEAWDLADPISPKLGLTPQGILDSKTEYDPEEHEKVWKKINKRNDKKVTKETVKSISKEYCYVMANDMYNKIGTGDFFNSSQLNNMHSHQIAEGTLTEKLLSDPLFAKADTFVTSAKFKPGLIQITKPGTIPLIDRGTVLNIYIPNYLTGKEGDVKFITDLFIWLIGEKKWKIIEQWIAYNIQYPGVKMKWAIVLVSEIEGAGKGLLARLLSRILGQFNVNENANYKHLTNTHNTLLIGTQVLVLNEVSLGDFKSKNEGTNGLKNFVADDIYSCNFKGKPMVKLPNFTNILLFSNDLTVLGLSKGSRRYYFCKINRTEEELIEKTDDGTFAKAWDFIDSDLGASALIYYFKEKVQIPDISIFKKRAPQTEDLIELIEQGKHPLQKKLEHDLTRPDLDRRKIFKDNFCGIMTFDELNDKLSTTDKDATEQYKWGSFGDDAIYKFLSSNSIRWNNGDTTRQISIGGVRQRFHLLDDSRCPIPGKSYKDLTPKQIEFIFVKYSEVCKATNEEAPNYQSAITNLPIKEAELKAKIRGLVGPDSYRSEPFEKEFINKCPDACFNKVIEGSMRVCHNDNFIVENIRQMRLNLDRGIRTPDKILEDLIGTETLIVPSSHRRFSI